MENTDAGRIYPGYPAHPATVAVGRVKVSQQSYELLDDYRMAVLTFAAAIPAGSVEDAYVAMEMRRRELAVHISAMEKYAGTIPTSALAVLTLPKSKRQ